MLLTCTYDDADEFECPSREEPGAARAEELRLAERARLSPRVDDERRGSMDETEERRYGVEARLPGRRFHHGLRTSPAPDWTAVASSASTTSRALSPSLLDGGTVRERKALTEDTPRSLPLTDGPRHAKDRSDDSELRDASCGDGERRRSLRSASADVVRSEGDDVVRFARVRKLP